LQGKKLFDEHYSRIGRPTEIEVYRYAVGISQKKLDWSDERICQYLQIEWMSKQNLQKLATTLKVNNVYLFLV